jgi:hypothetical protein
MNIDKLKSHHCCSTRFGGPSKSDPMSKPGALLFVEVHAAPNGGSIGIFDGVLVGDEIQGDLVEQIDAEPGITDVKFYKRRLARGLVVTTSGEGFDVSIFYRPDDAPKHGEEE